MTPY
jgi:hypothetical protein